MKPLEPGAMMQWLDTVQKYRASETAADRISGAVTRFRQVDQSLDTDSLFWTEPSNLEAALARLSIKGKDNE